MSQTSIPWQSLSEDALLGVVEDFVTREGTDYGGVAFELQDKGSQVLAQLQRNEAVIVFDAELDSCSIVQSDAVLDVDPTTVQK